MCEGGIEIWLHAFLAKLDRNGQIHASAALSPGKEASVTILVGQKAGWATVPV